MICTGWRAHIFLFRSSRPLASTPTAGALRLRFAVGPAGPAPAPARSGYRAIRRWGIGILAWRYAFLMPAVDLASLKQHGNPWALGRTCMPAGHVPSKFPGMGMRSGGLQVVPSRRPDRPRSVGRRLAPRRSTGARFFGGAFVPMNMVAASRSKKASSVAYTLNPKFMSDVPVIWIDPVFHIRTSTTRSGAKIASYAWTIPMPFSRNPTSPDLKLTRASMMPPPRRSRRCFETSGNFLAPMPVNRAPAKSTCPPGRGSARTYEKYCATSSGAAGSYILNVYGRGGPSMESTGMTM